MAVALVYKGSDGWLVDHYLGDTKYAYVNRGELLFWAGEVVQFPENPPYRHKFYIYDGGWKIVYLWFNTSDVPDNRSLSHHGLNGSLHALSKFNCRFYGMCHSASGGSYYSLRETTKFVEFDSNGNIFKEGYLQSNYKVIIGNGQGYTWNNDDFHRNYVRMWGYIRGDGAVVETFNKYICIQHIWEHPSAYAINTY